MCMLLKICEMDLSKDHLKPDDGLLSKVNEQLEMLLWSSSDELFEPGMESRFSGCLDVLLEKYNSVLFQGLILQLSVNGNKNSVTLAEALQWASWQSEQEFGDQILELLLAGLYHPSPLVRDSACSALVYYDELTARTHLKSALEFEPHPILAENLVSTINSLESSN